MFDFHFAEKGGDLRHEFKIIPKELCLKHGIEIFRNLISLLP